MTCRDMSYFNPAGQGETLLSSFKNQLVLRTLEILKNIY